MGWTCGFQGAKSAWWKATHCRPAPWSLALLADNPDFPLPGPPPPSCELAFPGVIFPLDSNLIGYSLWFSLGTFSLLDLYILMCGQRPFGKRHVFRIE